MNIVKKSMVLETLSQNVTSQKIMKIPTFIVMTIEAEKIYWENIPDLIDPFW